MRVVRSPEPVSILPGERSVFLAGSIDMGNTTDWQHDLASSLDAEQGVLLNPRRHQWDASWPTDAASPMFNEQVQWELSAIEAADLVVFYFHPGSQASIRFLSSIQSANWSNSFATTVQPAERFKSWFRYRTDTAPANWPPIAALPSASSPRRQQSAQAVQQNEGCEHDAARKKPG